MEGFHGTDKSKVKSILDTGLIPSIGDNEWLGDGGYFFVNGINEDPASQAEKWAIAESWDKNEKKYKYLYFAVLKGKIVVDEKNFLDLTTGEGVAILDYVQQRCIDKLKDKRLKFIDGFLINFARGEKIFDVKVAKGNFYIKFEEERILFISRRIPNCTICAIYNPAENIIDMEQIKNGRIKQ